MRVVVTGAAGFIGSHLATRLAKSEDVVGIDKVAYGSSPTLHAVPPPPFRCLQLDLSDAQQVQGTLHERDVVYHLAANADVRLGNQDTSVDLRNNLLATYHVLEEMRREDVPEIVFTSTSLVYAHATQQPTREDYGPLRPNSLYAASKLAAESYISGFSDTYGIKKTVFRFANVIGRNQRRMVTWDFVQKLRADPSTLVIRGNGKQRRSFLYIDDCVEGVVFLRGKSDGLFNLATRTTTPVDEVAQIVSEEFGAHPQIRYDRTHGDLGFAADLMEVELDSSKALAAGWEYQYESSEAVRATAKDFLSTTS